MMNIYHIHTLVLHPDIIHSSRDLVPPTDDFGGPLGKRVPSATAEARPFL
jgi:hypothetical protein